MKKLWLLVLVGLVLGGCGMVSPKGETKKDINLNLAKYDFDSLKTRQGIGSEIVVGGPIKAVEDRRKAANKVYESNFQTREIYFTSNGKKISGMMNFYPEKSSLSPVIIMIRGYAEKAGYYPGSGSWAVADKLAEAGYATISVDFLGFADSDPESTDVLEARFEKVESVLDLIESIKLLPWVDKNRIGIWAHSNGGQITLSVLEVTGGKYLTVLWAPMTQKFPDSVLSTIDEGSPVKQVMADFEKHYDARRYAFENYYPWIKASMLIQQGTADDQVKVDWQQSVVTGLKSLGKEIELVIYQGDDHNLKKNWEKAVEKDLEYYKRL
ncbi:MAG: prolyl oligopeptidase family serine peptidase [Candidatus Shapirobacteria bacterium]|nr:prolyl oligopeptidase family serine peptidase [Candidatus Shapirobacteria bacterium]